MRSVGVGRGLDDRLSVAGPRLPADPDRRNAKVVRWAEIYDEDTWRPFDTEALEFRIPAGHLPWWRGKVPLASLVGGDFVKTDIAVRQVFVHSLQSSVGKQKQLQNKLVEFSVFGLPLQTQEVYRLLLTVTASRNDRHQTNIALASKGPSTHDSALLEGSAGEVRPNS